MAITVIFMIENQKKAGTRPFEGHLIYGMSLRIPEFVAY